MSYYTSKHPGLFIYMMLVSASVISFLYFETNPAVIGVLSILWGIFTVMRVLSLYEVSSHFNAFAKRHQVSKLTNRNASALAHDLTSRMSGTNHFRRGLLAMNCMHERTLGWFLLAVFYVGYQMHIFDSAAPKAFLVQEIATFLMVGAAFWAGQSYAYSNQASRSLLILFTALFGLSIFSMKGQLFINLKINENLLNNDTTLWLLTILTCYCVTSLIYAFFKNMRMGLNVLGGLMLLIFMCIIFLLHDPSVPNAALWISGWALFSVFWIRAYVPRQKTYTLYQCE